jgi:hypothetical protein
MKQIWIVILLAPFLIVACNKSETLPPATITLAAIEDSVEQQLTERFPSYSCKIHQSDAHADQSYTVHITITHEGTENVHPMKLTRHADEKHPKRIYSGQIFTALFGEYNPQGETLFLVHIEKPDEN